MKKNKAIAGAIAMMLMSSVAMADRLTINSAAIQGLSYLGSYGRDKVGLYRNHEDCFLLIPGTDTNGSTTSSVFWNPKHNAVIVIFPSTADVKESLTLIYKAMIDKKTQQQASYRSKSILYMANQPYPLYGSSIENKPYPFLVASFSQNLRDVFANCRAFNVVFDDDDPRIGKAIVFFHLGGFAQALSAYNANCF